MHDSQCQKLLDMVLYFKLLPAKLGCVIQSYLQGTEALTKGWSPLGGIAHAALFVSGVIQT